MVIFRFRKEGQHEKPGEHVGSRVECKNEGVRVERKTLW